MLQSQDSNSTSEDDQDDEVYTPRKRREERYEARNDTHNHKMKIDLSIFNGKEIWKHFLIGLLFVATNFMCYGLWLILSWIPCDFSKKDLLKYVVH